MQLVLQAGAGACEDELPCFQAGMREASRELQAWDFSSTCKIFTLLLKAQVLHNSVLDLAMCLHRSVVSSTAKRVVPLTCRSVRLQVN